MSDEARIKFEFSACRETNFMRLEKLDQFHNCTRYRLGGKSRNSLGLVQLYLYETKKNCVHKCI